MDAKQLITHNLKRALKKVVGEEVEFEIQTPERFENGDYFTNIALRLSSKLSRKPLDTAYEIKKELELALDNSIIKRVDVAPPGFVNFFLSEKYLLETLKYIKKEGSKFGHSESLKSKKTMVEFTDPNPFKEFHIGHLYSNIVGESLSRLLESQGAQVWRVCYQGDVGMHVAKSLYGILQLKIKNSHLITELEGSDLKTKVKVLGEAYAAGAKAYEKDENAKPEIEAINKKVYERSDPELNEIYDLGKKWSLAYFETIYKRLGTKFDDFYFESEVGEPGAKLVREFLKKGRRPGKAAGPEGVFEESEGAVIFPGKKFGLHNRVFINSQGLPTYEAKELGLAESKKEDYPFDQSVIVTGNEINDYFKVVLKALEMIDPELRQKIIHISHGMVRLPGGKMSSRTGNVITGEWLMDEAVQKISETFKEMDSATSQKVGIAAIKYALLKSAIGRDTEFSFEESISLTGSSGPYLQYTYVRTKSVLEKAKSRESDQISSPEKLEQEELFLLRFLSRFPEIIDEASGKLAPNLVANYLFELAQKFNLFYQKHQIVGSLFRLQLTEAVGQVLKNGLNLLGIETVARM